MSASHAQPSTASFLALSRAFAEGSTSPSAFLEQCLAQIDARETDVKAFVLLDREAARARAAESSRRWAQGAPLSTIDGMPIGVKDVIETADMPTGMGSPLFEGVRTGKDSASVKALRSAGAIILGKTVTTEFASVEPGPTRNPWDVARTPGGSSSGSAAGVAAGMISAGLGTQVVGSIIRPASFCGCVGFKPSLGAINRGGSHDFMSQSCQGVIAASLADAWCVLAQIVARAGGDPGFAGLQGPEHLPEARPLRAVAVLETAGLARASAGARNAFAQARDAIEKSGVEVLSRRTSPDLERLEHYVTDSAAQTRIINAWESIWPLNVYRDRDASKISQSMLQRLDEAEAMSISDYRAALVAREHARSAHEALRGKVDALVTLSAGGAAPHGTATGDPAFSVPASYLGAPALTLPILSDEGLPLGLQIIGFRDDDASVFSRARHLLGSVFAAQGLVGLPAA